MPNFATDERFIRAYIFGGWVGVLANTYIFFAVLYAGGSFEVLSPLVSIVFFLFAMYAVRKNWFSAESLFLISSGLVMVEVVCHCSFFGWDSGFYYYAFLLPIIFFMNSGWRLVTKIIYNLLIADFLLAFWLFFTQYYTKTTLTISNSEADFFNFANLASVAIVTVAVMVYYIVEVDRKDKQLLLKNETLQVQNESILKQSHQQEILLKEIHHRVKNNLQVISSLISLQKHELTDENSVRTLNEIQRRISAIAMIHQKLYQDERVDRVDFKSYLSELVASSNQLKSKVNYIVDCPEKLELQLDTALPLGLIVSEMISNAIKYAFVDNAAPELIIHVTDSGNENYILKVKDNGPGLPEDFKFEQADSLGMEIIQALTEQIEGEVQFENNNGAQFKIMFENKW